MDNNVDINIYVNVFVAASFVDGFNITKQNMTVFFEARCIPRWMVMHFWIRVHITKVGSW